MTRAALAAAALAAAAAGALGGGTAAASWREPSPGIVGAWSFETAQYDSGCRMRGRMVIRRGEEPGAYLCDFIANERCPDTDSPVIDTHVEQRCIAGRDGADLVILSEIVEQDQALPYWPDNFRLTIHSSREMRGELRSADVAPVVFRRTPAPMS